MTNIPTSLPGKLVDSILLRVLQLSGSVILRAPRSAHIGSRRNLAPLGTLAVAPVVCEVELEFVYIDS